MVVQSRHLFSTVVSLSLLLHSGQANTAYKVDPILKLGERMGETSLKASAGFYGASLNDAGQIIFAAVNADAPEGSILVHYDNGKFTPIVVGTLPGPLGPWPRNVKFYMPLTMNREGGIAFAIRQLAEGRFADATFLWNARSRKVALLASEGMPAVNGLTFLRGAFPFPVTNDQYEVAFPAVVKNGAGDARSAIFLVDANGRLQSIVLPDQILPDGRKVADACVPSLNNAGKIVFRLHREADPDGSYSAYLWDRGTLASVAEVGAIVAQGGEITDVAAAWVNDQSPRVLLHLVLRAGNQRREAIYHAVDGRLAPVIRPGQTMPAGGIFRAARFISAANALGDHALIADIEEGGRTRKVAYRLDNDGALSLLVKTGGETNLGKVVEIEDFVSLNSRHQAVVALKLSGQPGMLALLTPEPPSGQ